MQRTSPQNQAKISSFKPRVGRPAPKTFLIPALIACLAVLIPLAYLVLRALEANPKDLLEIVFRVRNLELLLKTVSLGLGVVLACSLIALPLAWLTARTNIAAKGVLTLIGVLPLAVPGYVGAYAMLAATGQNGVLEKLFGITIPRPEGYFGALGVLALFSFPYLFLNLWNALRGLDPSLEESGRSLGLSQWQVFWRVILPQLRPAWMSGALLIALHVLGDFGVVSLTRFDTFSSAIYVQYNAAYDRVYAAWLGLMLLAITVGTLTLESRFLRNIRLSRVGSGVARKQSMALLGKWTLPAIGFVLAIMVVTLVIPLGTIVYWLLGSAAPDWQALFWALQNSAFAAAPTALVATFFAVPLAILGTRYAGPFTQLLERSAYLGYATPPLALALAFVFFSLRVIPDLYQTLTMLVVALAIHFLAEAIGPIRASLLQANPKLEEAARGLGFTSLQAFAKVTLVLIRRGLFTSLALVFLSCLKELPITYLLSPIGFDTLSRQIFGFTSESMFAQAAPYALAIVIASSLMVGLVLVQEQASAAPRKTP
jgi:iron(III) transport system permease protein